jgi:hypothetical protein
VELFSWNEFIAYNRPALKTCAANTGASILGVKSGANGPVVWQSQMSTDDNIRRLGRLPVRRDIALGVEEDLVVVGLFERGPEEALRPCARCAVRPGRGSRD